jgi:TPR repeat protein
MYAASLQQFRESCYKEDRCFPRTALVDHLIFIILYCVQIMSSNAAAEGKHIACIDDDMNNLQITCTEIGIDKCACCGKEGSDLNICNKCKAVKYCNVACKKKHRTKHKKKCERRVAELHDIELFKQPPPREDCPICMLPLPLLITGFRYKVCCGKVICSGCIHAVFLRDNGVGLCPFCRTPSPDSEEENIKRIKKRVEAGDAEAIFGLGCYYLTGEFGLPQDHGKALELWQQAGELGNAKAYYNVGNAYHTGEGVERDNKKADHYYELAAMGGDVAARHSLGNSEFRVGNWDRALKHYMVSAGDGYNGSVKNIQDLYKHGRATKEDYSNALRAYQKYLDDIKSEQRDIAAAFSEVYKYVE